MTTDQPPTQYETSWFPKVARQASAAARQREEQRREQLIKELQGLPTEDLAALLTARQGLIQS